MSCAKGRSGGGFGYYYQRGFRYCRYSSVRPALLAVASALRVALLHNTALSNTHTSYTIVHTWMYQGPRIGSHIVHSTRYYVPCTRYIALQGTRTMYIQVLCTSYDVRRTMYTYYVHRTLYEVPCTLYVHSSGYTSYNRCVHQQ